MGLPPILPTPSLDLGRILGLTGYKDFAYEFEDKDELWARATSDPTSISDDERRVVLRRPSAETEEANVKRVTNGRLTCAQLIAKAVTEPDTLSAEECSLIIKDFKDLTSGQALDRFQAHLKIGDIRCKALYEAQKALMSQEETAAKANAHRVGRTLATAAREVREAEKKALNIKLLSPPDWIQRLDGEWGFAFYRCQETAPGNIGYWRWIEHLEARKRATEHGLQYFVGAKEAFATRQLQFIDMIGSEKETLEYRQNFRTFQDIGLCRPSILKNTFLLITPESMSSSTKDYNATLPYPYQRSWVWALDPDWKSPCSDDDGYEGKVKVSWSHLYSWFYMVRSERPLTLKDLWRKANESTGVWSVQLKWSQVRDVPDSEFGTK